MEDPKEAALYRLCAALSRKAMLAVRARLH